MVYWVTSKRQSNAVMPRRWAAHWISVPGSRQNPTGVYRFRRIFELNSLSPPFILRVSADNRYRLFVNGAEVGVGPARGDLMHWRYETYNIAPLLQVGINVIAIVVWFAADDLAAVAQIGQSPELLVSAESDELCSLVDTDDKWRCIKVTGHSLFEKDELWTYCVVGPCERISADSTDRGWLSADFDDSMWDVPVSSSAGEPYGVQDANGRRMLVGNQLPQPARAPGRAEKIARSEGLHDVPTKLNSGSNVCIPRGTVCKLLLDNEFLTTAYPKLSVSGGDGSRVRQRYAESLSVSGDLNDKRNRDEIEGKIVAGYHDEFLPDGTDIVFEPLWYRTFRYVQLEVETGREELTISSFDYDFTAYDFDKRAVFKSSNPSLEQIWEVGWRTARLCAFESYMDCPYYEQLQYAGDTRLQCLISYYTTGDGRLARNAIEQIHCSLLPNGLTQSRYPSNLVQVIPPFSLWWIGMIHDYWMFIDDPAFVKSVLSAGRGVLEWFIDRISSDGLLGPIAFWPFVDWADGYDGGVSPGAVDGSSAVLTLQFVLALREQAEMELALGLPSASERYRQLADSLANAVAESCWDDRRGLLAETPDKNAFSQHSNSLALLAGIFDEETSRKVAEQVLSGPKDCLIQTGFYFRFYQHRALCKAGLGDRYLDWLGDWDEMLRLGLTTFAEKSDPTRSDCHAWSSHPLVGLLQIVLGVTPTKPGFREVTIHPHLGALDWAEGTVPHPLGEITVRLERKGGLVDVQYTLPAGVTIQN